MGFCLDLEVAVGGDGEEEHALKGSGVPTEKKNPFVLKSFKFLPNVFPSNYLLILKHFIFLVLQSNYFLSVAGCFGFPSL